MWEEDRESLLANPDAIELPLEQITEGRTVVAERDGELLGFSVVLRRDDGDAELDGLFVEPTQWRQGIGRMLVEQAEHIAARDGSANLWVIANTRALDFYDSCWFRHGRRSADALSTGASDAQGDQCRALTPTYAWP
jgi:GNAT superfamily N-acetyltransferase